MKEKPLYVFFSDEDIVAELREKLNIQEDMTEKLPNGNFEAANSFESQLKEANWSTVGNNSRYTVLYYCECYIIDDDDGTRTSATNIGHAHILVRHQTKEVTREENAEKIIEALTVLDENDML